MRPVQKLAAMLESIGFKVEQFPHNSEPHILPAEGYYRNGKYTDCYRWTASWSFALMAGSLSTSGAGAR